jgi:DNA polymerase-4
LENGRTIEEMAAMTRHILHVDLDAFFVAVEVARRPELVGKPVVVGGDPGGRGVVATASYEARKYGVFSAMSLKMAQRLCPHAIFLRGDYREYERVSKVFHAVLAGFTPLVESGGLDEAYLDITGCEGIVGTPVQAATSVRERVRAETNLAASVGIGTSRMIAKIASDRAKPDGLLEVLEGTEAAFLAPMPLRAMPFLGANTEKKLASVGLTTIGQLAAFSEQAIVSLLGPHGAVLLQRARGIDHATVGEGHEGRKSISREGTFNEDVASDAKLRSVVRAYSENVATQLREKGWRARTVSLKLRYGDFTTLSRSVTLKRPANSNDAVYEAANELFERLRAQDGRAVRLIGVGLSNFVEDVKQLSLETTVDEKQEKLSAAYYRVRTNYVTKSLQTGRTAFRGFDEDDRLLDRRTGLSSQIH